MAVGYAIYILNPSTKCCIAKLTAILCFLGFNIAETKNPEDAGSLTRYIMGLFIELCNT